MPKVFATAFSSAKRRLRRAWRVLLSHLKLLDVKVGIAVIIVNGETILLGERTGSDVGEGTYQLTGGHLEFNETFEQCAIRETLEETNLRIGRVKAVYVTNNIYPIPFKHYVTVWMVAEVSNPNELRVMEPKKCRSWTWFPFNDFPPNIFEGSDVVTPDNIRLFVSFLS